LARSHRSNDESRHADEENLTHGKKIFFNKPKISILVDILPQPKTAQKPIEINGF